MYIINTIQGVEFQEQNCNLGIYLGSFLSWGESLSKPVIFGQKQLNVFKKIFNHEQRGSSNHFEVVVIVSVYHFGFINSETLERVVMD